MENPKIVIIGAGLAGTEAALQLTKSGFNVNLYDGKPNSELPAYSFFTPAELICNNSLGMANELTASGMLIHELELVGSELIKISKTCRTKDSRYYAVDKRAFSENVSLELQKHGITIIKKMVSQIPDFDILMMATGPLTSSILIEDLKKYVKINQVHFSDASSLVVDIKSIDLDNNSIDFISDDLYGIRLSPKQVEEVYKRLCECTEKKMTVKENVVTFDNCQSIENIAGMGIDILLQKKFINEYYGDQPSLLLRREYGLSDGFILVGCMTTLRHSSQRYVFSSLPGFSNFKVQKYGRMHRNTFINNGGLLTPFFKLRGTNIYLLGQLSGLDGYCPAIASGYLAAQDIIHKSNIYPMSSNTMMGALANYVSRSDIVDFQPMCSNFSLLENASADLQTKHKQSILGITDFLRRL